jgi:serine/threonine protein kinase
MAIFREVGPYEIVRHIGRGMSPVFLASDSRSGATVALKVVPIGSDDEAREILEAEQQGADLQRRFSELTQYVPRVYEVDRAADYFYIAMEYIEGEDLSTIRWRWPFRSVGSSRRSTASPAPKVSRP